MQGDGDVEVDVEAAGAGAVARGVDPRRWLAEHGDVMWRFAMSRVRDGQVAEELIQETFVAALKGKEAFRGESSERTWLISILKHKIADWRRVRRREGVGSVGGVGGVGEGRSAGGDAGATSALPVDVLDTMFDGRGRWKVNPGRWPRDPERVLEEPEFWNDFERCLSHLPVGLAEAFVLREVRSQTADAICAALSITVENLWVRLHRARVLLRKCLERHWGQKGGRR